MSSSTSAPTAGLTIRTLSPTIGAEVSGITLREGITAEQRDVIRTLLFRHRVLVWRDQPMETADQVAVAEALGTILVFHSVVDPNPARLGVHEVHGASNGGWHFDASSLPNPPVVSMLRGVRVPPTGGDTLWASGVEAYRALSPALREAASGRYVTHGRGVSRELDDERPVVAHRLVRRHPVTGEHYLYLNLADWDDPLVLGMAPADSAALIAELRAAYLRPAHQLRLRWTPGTLVIWDNRLAHRGTGGDGDLPRHLVRICLADLSPVGGAEIRQTA